jgi:hypothetical protein
MNTSTLTIDQLLRAAQIIEQNVVTDPNKIFCNFGSDYEERDTITKMRAALCLNSNIVGAPSSSTGSSIRSSPTSMMSSSPNSPNDMKHRASSSQSTRQSRAAHNELEKNRRSQLRSFLEKLKSVLPADHDSTRDTTLSLLTRARNYLRVSFWFTVTFFLQQITCFQKSPGCVASLEVSIDKHLRVMPNSQWKRGRQTSVDE